MSSSSAGACCRGSGLGFILAHTRSPLVLPLLLLLPPLTALGNEGAAAGSCQCERHREEPPIAKRFPHRLLGWEPCGGLIRFKFPQKLVCGLADAPWVIALKRKGARRRQSSATSRAPLLLPLSSTGPAIEVLRGTPQPEQVPAFTTTAAPALETAFTTTTAAPALETAFTTTTAAPALEMVRTVTALPWNGAVAAVGPSHVPQEALPAGHNRTTVLSALGVTLLLAAGTVGLVCWRKPLGRRRVVLASEQQMWMLKSPGAEPASSPEQMQQL